MWADVSPRRARVAAATLALAQPRLPQLLQSWKILQCVCNERKTPNSKLEENATRKIYPRRKKAGISGGKIGGKWRKGGRGYFITAAADSGVDSTESRKKMDSPTAYSGALQAPPAKASIFHKISWTWYDANVDCQVLKSLVSLKTVSRSVLTSSAEGVSLRSWQRFWSNRKSGSNILVLISLVPYRAFGIMGSCTQVL